MGDMKHQSRERWKKARSQVSAVPTMVLGRMSVRHMACARRSKTAPPQLKAYTSSFRRFLVDNTMLIVLRVVENTADDSAVAGIGGPFGSAGGIAPGGCPESLLPIALKALTSRLETGGVAVRACHSKR